MRLRSRWFRLTRTDVSVGVTEDLGPVHHELVKHADAF
jgi:hypothetical protein